MSLPRSVDVAIVGAGPAGATLAALLSKYRPQTSVLVLDKTESPRFKLGESLIVDVNRILHDMEALDIVASQGFPRKYGATFVWGGERKPKTFIWSDGTELAKVRSGYHLDYTFHIDRPAYDAILVERARAFGAQVERGQEVRRLVWEDGRAVGVVASGADGVEQEVRARYVIDCAGGQGPLTRDVAGRQDDKILQNIAVHGYFKDVTLVDEVTGGPDDRRTAIVTTPRGWFWIIPVRNGLTSVGFVTSVDEYLASKSGGTTAFFERMLRELPEYEALFARAELVDYRGDGKMIHAVREYSYSCDRLWGPGWATVGDASGFVDAILSIGVFVAQNHAQFLAYALASVLDGACDEALAFGSFETAASDNLRAFRGVAHCFYAYNPDMTVWWRDCAERLRKSRLVPEADERAAFVAFFTGFAARENSTYEDALEAFGSSFVAEVSGSLFANDPFPRAQLDGWQRWFLEAVRGGDPVFRLSARYEPRPFALPAQGGRLKRVVRLDFEGQGTSSEATLGRRLYLRRDHDALLRFLDGQTPLSELVSRYGELAGAGAGDARKETIALLERLAAMGVLEPVEVKGARRA